MATDVIISIILGVVLILALIVKVFFARNLDYWEKRGVKYAKPIPFFGNYYDIAVGNKDTGSVVTEIAKQFPNEKVIGCFQGTRPALIVRDPELIKDITTKDFYYFSGRNPHFEDFEMEMMDYNLFSLGGPRWKVIRNNFSPMFTAAKMRSMLYLLNEANDKMQQLLDRMVVKENVVDTQNIFNKFTMEAIGSCVFGLNINNVNDEYNEFRRIGQKFFYSSPKISFNLFLKSAMPKLSKWLNQKSRDEEVSDFYFNLTQKMIALRKEEGKTRHDIIDTLVKLHDKGSIVSEVQNYKGDTEVLEMTVDYDLLAAQTTIFYAAGFETSSTAMTCTLFELAKNHDIQKRLALEIDTALKKTNGQITYDLISELTYLEMCLNEVFRLYPALVTITRMSEEPYTFEGLNISIDRGVLIHLAVKDIHHNPKYYPEPMKYDPERFSLENRDKIHPYTFLPFGEGPRICIGQRFGKIQAQVGLIGTLSRFWIDVTDVTCEKMEPHPWSHTVTIPKNPVLLKLTPRKSLAP